MAFSQRNNVHVNGTLILESQLSSSKVELLIKTDNLKHFPIIAIVGKEKWKNFKKEFPNSYESISISGTLTKKYGLNHQTRYIIYATNDNSISCFHSIKELNESGIEFYGTVKLIKKLDFTPESNLFLKKIILETTNESPIDFEVTVLRSVAHYFDEIEEGTLLKAKASYVFDSSHPPYWKMNSIPEVIGFCWQESLHKNAGFFI